MISVVSEEVKGKVYVDTGAIVHAQAEDLVGYEAFYLLMAQNSGEFQIHPFQAPPQVSIQGSWEMLLMESAQKKDETQTQFFSRRKQEEDAESIRSEKFEVPAAEIEISKPTPVDSRQLPPAASAATTSLHPRNADPVVASPQPRVRHLNPLPPAGAKASGSSSPAKEGNRQPVLRGEVPTGDTTERRRPRFREIVVCDPEGKILMQKGAANPDLRVTFLDFLTFKGRQISQGLDFGELRSLEVIGTSFLALTELTEKENIFALCVDNGASFESIRSEIREQVLHRIQDEAV